MTIKIAYITETLLWTGLKIYQLLSKYLSPSFTIKCFYKYDPSINISLDSSFIAFKDIEELKSKIISFKPDLIHLINSHLDPKVIANLLKLKYPIIEVLQFDDWNEYSYGIKHHVAISKFLLYFIFKRYKLSKDLIKSFSVIPNPVDVENIVTYLQEYENYRMNSSNKIFTIGLVGRPDSVKYYTPIFAKVLKLLDKRIKNWRFLAIGGIPESFRNLVKPLIDKGKVVVVGPKFGYELYKALASLDVFTTFAVQGETFGAAIVEAMASGLPIVVNGTPFTPNAQTLLVDNGINGFVANSIKGYVDAIVELYNNEELRIKMGEAGREKAVKEYHPKKVIPMYEDVYNKVLNGVEIQNSIDLRSIKEEFIYRSKNTYDKDIKYLIDRIYTYYLCRKFIAGNSNIKIIKALIKKLLK
jgi:glycosyltransferase involved in cell wall biosynthesis